MGRSLALRPKERPSFITPMCYRLLHSLRLMGLNNLYSKNETQELYGRIIIFCYEDLMWIGDGP